MADKNFQEILLAELQLVFEPLLLAGAESGTLFALFYRLGWNLESLLGDDAQDFLQQIETIIAAIKTINDWVDQPPQTLDELDKALKTIQNTVEAISQLPTSIGNPQFASLTELPLQLIEYLFLTYLAQRQPPLYGLFVVLKIVEEQPVAEEVKEGVVVREATTLLRLRSCLKRLNMCKTAQHDAGHGNVNEGFAALR